MTTDYRLAAALAEESENPDWVGSALTNRVPFL